MSVSPMVLERASDLGAVHDTVPWVRARGGCRLPLWQGGGDGVCGREARGFWLSPSLPGALDSFFLCRCGVGVAVQTNLWPRTNDRREMSHNGCLRETERGSSKRTDGHGKARTETKLSNE